jgi:hypothetical protein
MMAIDHVRFVKTHKLYTTESEPKCTLGDLG